MFLYLCEVKLWRIFSLKCFSLHCENNKNYKSIIITFIGPLLSIISITTDFCEVKFTSLAWVLQHWRLHICKHRYTEFIGSHIYVIHLCKFHTPSSNASAIIASRLDAEQAYIFSAISTLLWYILQRKITWIKVKYLSKFNCFSEF
jgi:hypothetical protein